MLRTTADLQFLDLLCYPPLYFASGSLSVISGVSGSGKSTYLRLLNRTLLPSGGQIYFQNQEVGTLDVIAYRRQVLLIPQEVYLIEGTIRENFAFYYASREQETPANERIDHYLRLCCADFPPETSCDHLSGGERQRIFLAIFLSFEPSVLLLDEPTAALDDRTAQQLFHNLQTACHKAETTCIVVSHNPDLIEPFADQRIHFSEGRTCE